MTALPEMTIADLWQAITPEPTPRPARGRVTPPAAAALQELRGELTKFLLGHPLRPLIEQASSLRSADAWAATETFFAWAAEIRSGDIIEQGHRNGAIRNRWPPAEINTAIVLLGQCALSLGRPALDSAVDHYVGLIARINDQVAAVARESDAIVADVAALIERDADLCIALEVATYIGYRARQIEEIRNEPELFWEKRDLREEAGIRLPPVLTDEESARHLAYLLGDREGASRAWHDTLVGELSPYLVLDPARGIIETLADAYSRRGGEPYWISWRAPAIRVFGATRTLGELSRAGL